MNILILNTSELTGGAAVAANRLMKALHREGVEVSMLVRNRNSQDKRVVSLNDGRFNRAINFIRFLFERVVIFLCNHLKRKPLFQVSIANTGIDVCKHPLVRNADVIHLHWINQGLLSLEDIKRLLALGKPVVWTMHDMWPSTAICHYAFGCEKFKDECGACPFLSSTRHKDLSNVIFNRKRFLSDSAINIVTVSSWLKRQAEASALTRSLTIDVIPNVIDTSIFKPYSKDKARAELSLPKNKRIILMGAARINDPVKGFEYLVDALRILKQSHASDDYMLLLFGGIKGDSSFLSSIPIEYVWKGSLSDPAEIAKLYAAADVTVVSSLYETFGQTIIEGMACGCPAVTFNNSGQTDIIDHLHNGYLAKYRDAEDLASGIEWVLDNSESLRLSESCVEKVRSCYSEEVVAKQYISLYKSVINNNRR